MREEAVVFGGKAQLVGIISNPSTAVVPDLPAVIFLNAGGLHRVGPSRLYVNAARALAEQGFIVLRFDFSGFGDSGATHDDIPFAKKAFSDTRSAMDFLTTTRGVDCFILMGICSGAEAAFDVSQSDARVVGIVLINGSGYDPASVLNCDDRRLSSGLRAAKFMARAWPRVLVRKLTRGIWGARHTAEVSGYLLRNLVFTQNAGSNISSLRKVADRGAQLLLVYEGGTCIPEYLQAVTGNRGTVAGHLPNATISVMNEADHTFNSVRQQELLIDTISSWAGRWSAVPNYEPACDSLATWVKE